MTVPAELGAPTEPRWGRLDPGVVAWIVVLAGTAFTAGVLGFLAVRRHDLFLSHAFDMAHLEQALWKLRNFDGTFSTVIGFHVVADHTRYILFPLAFLVPSSPSVMVSVQAAVLAAGAVPVFVLTRRQAGDLAGVVVAALYLLHPTLHSIALYDFHPEVLATPVLLGALLAADSERWPWYWAAIAVALLCREDVAVAVMLVGLVLAVTKRTVPGLVTLGVGAVVLVVDLAVMSALGPEGASNLGRYEWLGDGPVEMVRNLVLHAPSTFAGRDFPLTLPVVLTFTFGYLLPAPLALAAGLRRAWAPLAMMAPLLLADTRQQNTIWFHYGYVVLPFLYYAAAHGAGSLRRLPDRVQPVAWTATVAIAGVAFVVFSVFTAVELRPRGGWPKPANLRAQFLHTHPEGYIEEARQAVALVPDGAPVTAGGSIISHLAQRDLAYMSPNPFLKVWYGDRLTAGDPEPGTRPTLPRRPPEWVVIDHAHTGPESPQFRVLLLEFLDRHYQRAYDGEFVTVYRRPPS